MPEIYTASVIGGGSGGRLSLNALVASDRYRLIAAADISETARQGLAERYPGIALYASHQELFAEQPSDVVCVSTWPPSHRDVVLDALATGPKGILCEKPLAHVADQGGEILEAIAAAGLPVVVPHGLLKARHAEQILDRVRGGEIGDLELVEIECGRWDIMNAGIHWLDYFVALSGSDPMTWVMAAVESSTQTYRDGLEVETTGITYVQTASGVRCVMHTGDEVLIRRPNKGVLFRLVGSLGVIEFWAWESAYRLLNAAHPHGELFEVEPYPQSAHQRYLEDLAVQIDSGAPDYTLPRASLVALELCEGAYLSARHRCKVELPLVDFQPPEPLDWHPGQPYRGQGGRNGRQL
jgi:predicted dehydrogenase